MILKQAKIKLVTYIFSDMILNLKTKTFILQIYSEARCIRFV